MKKWTFCRNWRRAMKRNRFASRGCANGLRGVALFLCVILGGMWASAATTAQLRAAFPGATVSGSTVTLTADIGPCVLTNTWGTVTVDLNGHSITSGVASTPAIRIDSVAKPTASTVLRLNLTGTGRVIGGAAWRLMALYFSRRPGSMPSGSDL